jgi:hypothetical protein
VQLKGSQISYDIRMEAGSSLPTSKAARQAFLMDLFQSGAITADMLLDLIDMGGTQKLTEQIRIDMRQAQRENIKMKSFTPADMMMHEMKMQSLAMTGGGENQAPDGAPMWDMDPRSWPAMVEVHDYDNHEVHIRIHDNFRKGQEFESLSEEVKHEFEKHISMHKMALQANMFSQMMGKPPMPGEESTAMQGTNEAPQMPGMGGPPPTEGGANQFTPPQGGETSG